MALGVFGDVCQQADDSGWQTLAADLARLGKGCGIDAVYHGFGFAENAIELGEKGFAIRAGLVFGCGRR